MATKVTILGMDEPKEKELKKIEFVKYTAGSKSHPQFLDCPVKPSEFTFIELVSKAANDQYYDIMFAHHGNRSTGNIYLGHFNDGIV